MQKKIFTILLMIVFLLTSFQNVLGDAPINQNLGNPQAEWTVLIYMAADNDLGTHAQNDIDKLRAASQFDDSGNVNIIVLSDTYGTGNSKIKSIKNGIVENIDDNGSVIPDSNEVNMGDPQTLINFGTWSIENYPANHYMFVLWGHGFEAHPAWTWPNAGWFYKICVDVTSKDSLYISNYELINALDSITNQGSINFDIIAFDSCLSALVEIAYEVKDYATLMIAPQDNQYMIDPAMSWADYGFDYYNPISDLVDDPNYYSNKAKNIELCSKFVDNYPTDYYDGSTLSVIDLDNIQTLADSLDNLGDYLNDKFFIDKNPEYILKLDSVMEAVKQYSYVYPDTFCAYYGDLYDFADIMINYYDFDNQLVTIAQQIKQKISVIVLDDNIQNDESHGISAFVAEENCGGSKGSYKNLQFYEDNKFGQFIYNCRTKWNSNSGPTQIDISGPSDIFPDVEYSFTVRGTDPEADYVFFEINWIDLQEAQIYGPYPSGEDVTITHTWSKEACREKEGHRSLRFEVHDYWSPILGVWDNFGVNIHKTKNKEFINKIFKECPIIFSLLRLVQRILN